MEIKYILITIVNTFSNSRELMQNTEFYLRKMIDTDHRNFLELSDKEAGVNCNSDKKFGEVFLDVCQRNAVIFSIIDKCTNNYIGYVMVKHTDTSTPELGISVRPEYQSHGIGTAALKMASQTYVQTHPIDYFLIRVKKLITKLASAWLRSWVHSD